MSKILFLDLETTSLDDTRGEVWEIGAIEREAGQPDREFLWQLWPDLSTADPNSLRIGRFYERTALNGLIRPVMMSATDVAIRLPVDGGAVDYPRDTLPKESVAADLAVLLDGAHVVGAVPDFDYRFLRRFLATHGHAWTAHYHLVDVEALAVGYLHGRAAALSVSQAGPDWLGMAREATARPWKSTDLYRAVGVDPGQYEAHTALGDARLVRAVYDAITGGA